jgi:hypothetical protein
MKFYKRQTLDTHNPSDNRMAVLQDGRAIVDTALSLRLPRGETVDRPTDTTTGQVRQNTILQELETIVRTTWERVRTVRPATITVQNLGSGNYYSNIFGPLNKDYQLSLDAGAQNVMVYVDNVYQIPLTNYDFTTDPSPVSATTTGSSTATSYVLQLSTVQNVQPGAVVSGSVSITSGTMVVSTIVGTNNIVIDTQLTGNITSGTNLTFTFSTGTYLQFSGAVPAKPVVVLLGHDGYFPPQT